MNRSPRFELSENHYPRELKPILKVSGKKETKRGGSSSRKGLSFPDELLEDDFAFDADYSNIVQTAEDYMEQFTLGRAEKPENNANDEDRDLHKAKVENELLKISEENLKQELKVFFSSFMQWLIN